ncbi:MAG: KH domain-containing protein, partial [Firmicutes bacterium]|nr:KH domain-containing protein [Bacillota bacterium]
QVKEEKVDIKKEEVKEEVKKEETVQKEEVKEEEKQSKLQRTTDPIVTAEKFLKEVFESMKIEAEMESELVDNKQLKINIKGNEMGVIIGKRGQTLDSLQYLTNLVINKGESPYISVTLNTESYRERRKETLESLAFNLAKKAKHLRKNVILEPMNPYERRIIHSTLQNDRYVTTYSEGTEPHRYVVISPKKHY